MLSFNSKNATLVNIWHGTQDNSRHSSGHETHLIDDFIIIERVLQVIKFQTFRLKSRSIWIFLCFSSPAFYWCLVQYQVRNHHSCRNTFFCDCWQCVFCWSCWRCGFWWDCSCCCPNPWCWFLWPSNPINLPPPVIESTRKSLSRRCSVHPIKQQ